MPCECNTEKTKVRSEDEYRSLINRLNRIEGQVGGIKRMVERNSYCIDILTQVASVISALEAFNRELLSSHIRTCVVEDIKADSNEKVEELLTILRRIMK